MKHKLNLVDPREGLKKERKSIWFTWCNSQRGNIRIYGRLDMFYANRELFYFNKTIEGSRIRVQPCSLFDHHPINGNIVVGNQDPRSYKKEKKYILNSNMLEEKDCCNDATFTLKKINNWILKEDNNIGKWDYNVNKKKLIIQTTSKKKAMDNRKMEVNRNEKLLELETGFKMIPII